MPLINRVLDFDEIDGWLFMQIYHGVRGRHGYTPSDAACAFGWELTRLVEKVSDSAIERPENLYDKIEKFIRNHGAGMLTLKEILNKFDISKSSLERIFRRHHHIEPTPGQMLRKLRINYAKDLLLCTNNQIGEIARICGYSDQFAFSRAFKKIIGHSPSEFRLHHGDTANLLGTLYRDNAQ